MKLIPNKKEVNDFITKEIKFEKVPYKREWKRSGITIKEDGNGIRVYDSNHKQITAKLIYLHWNNFVDFKHIMEDIVKYDIEN